MILSGEKKEDDGRIPLWLWNDQSKEILFKNGYGNDAPYFTEECTIREGSGNEEWGTETGKKYYILEIRKIT